MPSLSNLQGFWLDGKEVRRASLGGKVFYEKHDYDFTLVSDKDVISCYDGDTAILTAHLTDYDEPVTGETVIFSSEDVIESTVVDTDGTYDFGDYFVINCANMPINQKGSYTKEILIGNDSGRYIQISKQDGGVIVMKNGVGNGGFADELVIKDGVLKGYQPAYQKYVEFDVSNVNLFNWDFFGDWSQSSVSVDSYFYETGTTDSNGECSVPFESKGAGDLNIKAECMNLQETYELEDCIRYWSNEQIDHYNDMIVDYSLPSDFEIDFGLYSTAPTTGTSIGLIRFNSSGGVWCGKGSSSSRNISFNGSTLNTINANTQYDYVFRYKDGTARFSLGDASISSTISLTKLYLLSSRGGTHVNYLKIKPL